MTGMKIIAAVLDTEQLILYKTDGETFSIPQGDPRIRPIIDKITPILNAGGIAEVTLEHFNEFAAFEKKTSGLIKLFRVAKKAVAHLMGSDEEREALKPTTLGQVPTPQTKKAAIDEIMANATPVSSPSYKESDTTSDHTMVAVVGNGASARIVPGVEALKDQMSHSVKLGSTKGVEALVTRLSRVVEKRGHSVQDVLRFLEKGDLPIADDGSIIAYKILKTGSNTPDFPRQDGLFFDCHTGRIPQKVGTEVRVAEHLVDRDRRNDCSNGLHIARRGYLGNFPGDVCVLVRIAPEDVVTVPHNDPNKVRVCAYQILGVIPDAEFRLLRVNRPMTESSECQRLLGMAISGRHAPMIQQVTVTEQQGKGIQVTNLVETSASIAERITAKSQPAPTAVALDDKTVTYATVVDPKDVSQVSKTQKGTSNRVQLATELMSKVSNGDLPFAQRKEAAVTLTAFKKKAKVSYSALGISTVKEEVLKNMLGAKEDPAKPASPKKPVTPAPKPLPTKLAMKVPEPVIPEKVPTKPLTRKEQAGQFAMTMMSSPDMKARQRAAISLMDLKKKSKSSWADLGIMDSKVVEEAVYPSTPNHVSVVAKTSSAPKKTAAVKAKPEQLMSSEKVTKAEPTPALSPRQQEAKRLYDKMSTKLLSAARTAALELRDFKKKSKVSWEALGLPADTRQMIDKLTQ